MKIVKDKDKKSIIKVPPGSRVPIVTPPNLFEHHGIQLVLGKRQSGKSVFITNYLRMLKQADKADRILVISPTILSNKALLESLGIEDQDCFDPDDPEVIPKIVEVIDEERDEYEAHLNKLVLYKQYQKLINSKKPITEFDEYMLCELSDANGDILPPQSKYGHRPCLHLFVDDCQSSRVFRDKKFLNLAIRHRHMGGMMHNPKLHKEMQGAIGISLYIAIQNLKAQGGSCPKAIRNNATQLVIVGKVKDKKELDDIYSSVAGEIDVEPFMKGYEYATAEPHNSFVIDLHPKKTHPSRFRKNMNEFLMIE
jgi:hypothetical protein